ncbi:SIRBL protein, partial [Anseranas semipalmata]|nr:SIRBL protein [Anseranas semipalmata]
SPGVGAQAGGDFKLRQPQKEISVTAGETLTLNCTVSGTGPLGPVKWLKGWGSGSEIIYDQRGSSPRVTRAVDKSNTDFTILISDVRREDAGTYYCVKFRKAEVNDKLFQHGNGTVVSVQARPSNPVVSGPSRRAGPGQSVPFTCRAGGFFPRDIDVKWLKDRAPVEAQQTSVTPGPSNSSYNMSSTVMVTLRKDDVRSELTCEVRHATLTAPLTETYQLGRALRVPPNMDVVAELPGPVEVNKMVNFTCHVQEFYPEDVTVTWLENGTEMNAGSTPQLTETAQGLFKLRSTVAVEAVEEKNGSTFTCRVVHDGQDPISRMAMLRVAAPAQQGSSGSSNGDNSA